MNFIFINKRFKYLIQLTLYLISLISFTIISELEENLCVKFNIIVENF